MLRYVSTRGRAPALEFGDVLLHGLATDGGLYIPETWPTLPPVQSDRAYTDLAEEIMWPFVEGSFNRDTFSELCRQAYDEFEHPDVAPLTELGDGLYLLELFHGPTLAFKDIALQLVGRMFSDLLARRGEQITIVGATAGDTGSAAIDAVRDRPGMRIIILHPAGRVSEVQRRQMTTVLSPNVHNIAIDGTFDDCQDLVKAMFADEAFRKEQRLSAVNSINWARVMAQTVYYVRAASLLGSQPVSFSVPSGNFGNVYAGYVAGCMGLQVDRLVVASNRNDILTRFFNTGTMTVSAVHPTLSPSMDIQVSSNLERLLFDLWGRDGHRTEQELADFRASGCLSIDAEAAAVLSRQWQAERADDEQTTATIAETYAETGVVLDPHTAVGVAAARRRRDPDVPMVVLSTAHPAKFNDAVEEAIGHRVPLPERLAIVLERTERCQHMPNDLAAVERFVADTATQ